LDSLLTTVYDADYRSSLKDWNSFVESLTEELTKIDDTVPELPLKDVVFRIYRDIRFSKDPTPYKPYFSAAWLVHHASRTGRKGPYAAYYVQISPNDSFRYPLRRYPLPDRLTVEFASSTASIQDQAVSDKISARSFSPDLIRRGLNNIFSVPGLLARVMLLRGSTDCFAALFLEHESDVEQVVRRYSCKSTLLRSFFMNVPAAVSRRPWSFTPSPGSRGGYWSPDARALAALRTTIDKNPQRLKDVLMNDKMRAEFLSGSSTKTAVKSFVKTNSETALKTKPKVSTQLVQAGDAERMTASVQPPSRALWLATLTTSHLDKSERKSILLLACLMHQRVARNSTALTVELAGRTKRSKVDRSPVTMNLEQCKSSQHRDEQGDGNYQPMIRLDQEHQRYVDVILILRDIHAEIASKTREPNLPRARGYDAGHTDIDLLRLRRFTVGTKLTDAEVLDAQVLRRIADLFSALHPNGRGLQPWYSTCTSSHPQSANCPGRGTIACLNRIVLPDPGEEEDDDEDDEGGDEDGEAEDEQDGESGTEVSDAYRIQRSAVTTGKSGRQIEDCHEITCRLVTGRRWNLEKNMPTHRRLSHNVIAPCAFRPRAPTVHMRAGPPFSCWRFGLCYPCPAYSPRPGQGMPGLAGCVAAVASSLRGKALVSVTNSFRDRACGCVGCFVSDRSREMIKVGRAGAIFFDPHRFPAHRTLLLGSSHCAGGRGRVQRLPTDYSLVSSNVGTDRCRQEGLSQNRMTVNVAAFVARETPSLSRRCIYRAATPHAVRCTACKLQSERKGGQTKEEKCDVIPDAMHLRFVPGLLSI
ncbi:hypothetical protein KCU62_g12, partial [Aureobasidium sp. EXF-3399]